MSKPTESALRERISNQLRWRGPTDTVALIWHGYLTALLEWGLIDVSTFSRLTELLPKKGFKKLYEMCLDEPIKPEHEKKIDRYLNGFNNGIVRRKRELSTEEKVKTKEFSEWIKSYFESKGNKVITITRESRNQNNEP